MVTSLGTSLPPSPPTNGPASAPPALRTARPGWRDPRLWLGVAIVAASVVGGARLLAAADDTVQVWSLAGDVAAGHELTESDLVAERVHFADAGAVDSYFTVDDELPADLEVDRPLDAGELLPRGAVGSAGGSGLVHVPLSVEPELVPGSVRPGAVVDVYVVAAPSAQRRPGGDAGPALAGVAVLEAPPADAGFGAGGRRQLVVAVPEDDAAAFFTLLGDVDTPSLTVVRRD
ncbi:hypothetical protein [Nocardioides sp. SYSU D00038]|uniref:hypothetical protein n=1 Tax=Nocardioides sp. SYSU D00038 TaxID=2812554 RepID=UPI001967E1E0|nr:hypothetical protein [Nocardioides sp. SYSU D00038]